MATFIAVPVMVDIAEGVPSLVIERLLKNVGIEKKIVALSGLNTKLSNGPCLPFVIIWYLKECSLESRGETSFVGLFSFLLDLIACVDLIHPVG